MAWLDDHPPARSQFRCPRRAAPSGVIVVHTAENVMDTVGPDTGAEAVARFIQGRSDPGSYHDLVDSDSYINLVRWTCEAFHDGTGSNPHSLGLSFACSYLDWPKMSALRRGAFIERGAQRAAAYARWCYSEYGIVVPARRISRAQSEMRVPGFISHAERDPARRKDPGNEPRQFPWTTFLARFAMLMGYVTPTPPPDPTPIPPGDDEMAPYAFWKFPGKAAVYQVGANAIDARKIDNLDSIAFAKALLRLGGFSDAVHEVSADTTADDHRWLKDLLADAGIPVT